MQFLTAGNRAILLAVGLVIASFMLLPTTVPLGHAASTLVCLSTTTYSCPASPPVFTGSIGSTVKVNVVIQDAAAFNGFQVWLGSSSAVLNTTSFDLSGSILLGATPGFECINGKGCQGWLGSGPGTDALYASGSFTGSNTTGLLFTVNYRVVGNATGSPLGLYFQVSPSGWDSFSVGISFSSGDALVPVQDGTFTTGPGGIVGSVGNVSISQTITFSQVTITITGNLDLNTTSSTLTGTVTVRAVNNTSGAVVLSKTFSIFIHFGNMMGQARFVMVIPTTPLALGAMCAINTSTDQASCMATRNPDPAYSSSVNIIDVSMIELHFGATQGSALYDPSLDFVGAGAINITDLGIELADYGAQVFL
jgi:hypothetical protein